MKIKKTLASKLALFAGITALLTINAAAQTVLFSDDFETNSSSRWVAFGVANAANGNPNDYKAIFATNYSTMTYRFNGAVKNIPPAPHSTTNTTRGLYVTANKLTAPPNTTKAAAVSLYPAGLNCTGNFALRFDMFMDYNGDAPGGGTGSTEFATFGLNHAANKANWSTNVNGGGAGDGVWFAAAGEGGTTRDYRVHTGPINAELQGTAGGLYDRNLDGTIDFNVAYDVFTTNNAYWDAMPAPPGQSAGAPGKQWVSVEIKQVNGVITWSINGYVVASANYGGTYTSGDVMIGYMDNLNGVANPSNENYAIFDNIEVVTLGSTAVPVVDISVSKTDATKPGSGPSTYGVFTFNLSDGFGSPVTSPNPLVVKLAISGTASNGLDYTTISTNFTIPANTSTATLNVMPTSRIANPVDNVFIKLLGSTNYDLRTGTFASIAITDPRGVPAADIQAYRPVAYENFHKGVFSVGMASPSAGNLTINYVISGSATNGVHYVTLPGSVVVPANTTNAFITITPINNSIIDTNRAVTLTITNGTGYRIGSSSNATIIIRNDDLVTSSVPFSDNLDTDSSANWIIKQTEPSDQVLFAYDYSQDGITSSPNTTNGSTLGLKLQADYTAGFPAGITLCPKGGNFSGDYRLRFDVWLNYNGDAATGLPGGGAQSTQNLIAGVGTTGDHPQGTTNATSDGIWFRSNTDGSSTVADDFAAFRGNTELLLGSSVYVGGSQGVGSSYYSEFGLEAAPSIQSDNISEQAGLTLKGCIAFAWHDVTITKLGTNVTWAIDGLPIAIVPITTALSSNVFIGFTDPVTGSATLPSVMFALFDNVRVESLAVAPLTAPVVTGVQRTTTNIVINFTGAAADAASSFSVLGASTLSTNSTDYTATGAPVTGSGGTYQATVPMTTSARFFRIKR
jgi:hypothetical protein